MENSDVAFKLFFEATFIVVVLAGIVWALDPDNAEGAFRVIGSIVAAFG
ncbi:MAG: hypothetical protein AAF371_17855 [Pseudomonadota bacterium]